MMKNTLSIITDHTTLIQRFVLIRGTDCLIFDLQEKNIISKNSVIEMCTSHKFFDLWALHPNKKTCTTIEVGYDSQERYDLPCNIYDGTPDSEVRLNSLLNNLISVDGDK